MLSDAVYFFNKNTSVIFLYTDYLKNLLEESADYRDTQGKYLFILKKQQLM